MNFWEPYEAGNPGQQALLHYLQRVFPLTEEQIQVFFSLLEHRFFDKKSLILGEGETDGYLNMVVRGMVRKFVRRGKNDFILQLATEGHVVDSEVSFIRQEPSLVFLEAIEPTQLVSISYDNLQNLIRQMPGAERMGRLMIMDMFIKKDERHYRQLRFTARERFMNYVQNHPHMLQRVPQKYLASYLNIKPETFSRLKHLLKGRNLPGHSEAATD